MKSAVEAISSQLDNAEEWVSKLEDKVVEVTPLGDQKEKRIKANEGNWRDLWDNIKHTNIKVPEGEQREKDSKHIWRESQKIFLTSEGNRHPIPRSTDPQKDEAHSKTHNN